MDQFETLTRIVRCKVENETYSTNLHPETYVKEEIIVQDMTDCFDNEASSATSSILQTDPFERSDENESELTLKEQIRNQDDSDAITIDICKIKLEEDVTSHEEALLVDKTDHLDRSEENCNNIEADNFDNNSKRFDICNIKLEDFTSHEESLLLNKTDRLDWSEENCEIYSLKTIRDAVNLQVDSNDKDKQNITPDEKECKKSKKQTTTFNFLKKPSRESRNLYPVTNNTYNSVDKNVSKNMSKAIEQKGNMLESLILICPKCSKKEKLVTSRRRTQCRDCKDPMVYDCLTCGDRMKTINASYYHVRYKCGRQRTNECEQCIDQGKSEYFLCCHVTSQYNVKRDCPKCGKKISKSYWSTHKKICGINLFYLKCKFCPFDSKYRYSILKHIQTAHKNIKPHQYTDIIKAIIKQGEKIRVNALNSADSPEVSVPPTKIDYKKFIQLYCSKCNEICGNVDYRKERNCPGCKAARLLHCIKCSKRYPKITTMYMHLRNKCAALHRFYCEHCDYSTGMKQAIAGHIARKHMDIAFEDYEKCSKCNRGFKHRSNLKQHEKRCNRELEIQCNICSHRLKTIDCFNFHMENHILYQRNVDAPTSKPADDARVKDTGKTPNSKPINSTEKLSQAKPMSKTERLKVQKLMKTICPKCDKSVKCKKGNGKCSECETKLSYVCVKCGKTWLQFYHLWTHVIHGHLIDELKKRQKCLLCGRRFILINDLLKHKKYCGKQPDLQCAHCRFMTRHRNSLLIHLRNQHCELNLVGRSATRSAARSAACDLSKMFVCAQCNKEYRSVQGLIIHRKNYCGKQPSLACDECDYKAYTKCLLISHLKRMHKYLYIDQELRCRYCGKESFNVYKHNVHVDNCSLKYSAEC